MSKVQKLKELLPKKTVVDGNRTWYRADGIKLVPFTRLTVFY